MKVHCSSPQETGDFWNLLFCILCLHPHTSFLTCDIYSSRGVWDSRCNQALYTHELRRKINLKSFLCDFKEFTIVDLNGFHRCAAPFKM